MSSRAPRVATWILERCISDYQTDSFIGDLIEQYRERGRWWYWRQALGAMRIRAFRALTAVTETKAPTADVFEDIVAWIALAACSWYQVAIFAYVLLSWIPLIRSNSAAIIVSVLIDIALMAAAGAGSVIRVRMNPKAAL